MQTELELSVARRLKAIREELEIGAPTMAERLGVSRTRYLNWERADNLPNERAMTALCDQTGLTLDYIYRGRLDGVPVGLAIRVSAREVGQNPDTPGFQPTLPPLGARRAKQQA